MRKYPLMHQMITDMQQSPMRFLTVEAVASELSVHSSTVRRLIDAGTLPGVRLGDGDGRGQLVRVRACDLERFIAEREADGR
jgi:excisionase family DNA binding protein